MEKNDPIRDFIETLSQLNHLESNTIDMVDEILAKWFVARYPEGIPFEFDFSKRDLLVEMINESYKIGLMLMSDEVFQPYLEAILAAVSGGGDKPMPKLKASFILGYCLKLIQEQHLHGKKEGDKS